MSLPNIVSSAGKGVTQVIERCENAKVSGYLDLSSCSLMYIADAIYLVLKGHDVDKCSLRNNSLKKFPKKMITKFPNMTVFNIEGNEVAEIPEEFGEWTSMRGVNMANNKIEVFPEGIYAMKDLAVLDISGNAITDVDAEKLFTSLPKLVQLNIAGNKLPQELKSKLSEKRPPKVQLNL